MRVRSHRGPALLAALLVACGCAGTESPLDDIISSSTRQGSGNVPSVPMPNQVAGGDRSGQRLPGARAPEEPVLTPEQVAANRTQRRQQAEALWNRAANERNPGNAADLFGELADEYPDTPRAAEARFREGKAYFSMAEYDESMRVLGDYMLIAPVNPHLAEVEEMIYLSAVRSIRPESGLAGIFVSNEDPLNGLEYVTIAFPAGQYADDALMRIAEYYEEQEDFDNAVLHYKELLIRYPDSEWSFKARVALGDSYAARDQGPEYDAGFVDRDPREKFPSEEAALQGAPVKSALRLSLAQYDAFLARIDQDPGRRAEYASEYAHVQRRRAQVREGLAAKDLARANWYAGRGDRQGARTYYRFAAAWSDTPSGRRAQGLLQQTPEQRPGAMPVPGRVPVGAPAARPRPAPRATPPPPVAPPSRTVRPAPPGPAPTTPPVAPPSHTVRPAPPTSIPSGATRRLRVPPPPPPPARAGAR